MNEDTYESEQSTGSTKEGRSLTALAAFVQNRFDDGVRFRQRTGMDEELFACKYAVKGEYAPDELAKRSAAGLPLVYAPLSDTKRRAANAWAHEIFLNTAEKTYELRPTPVPDMPETIVKAIAAEVVQEWAAVVSPNPPQGEQQLAAVAAMAAKRRDELQNLVEEEAQKRAARLDKVIQDRLVEGRWREEMTLAIDYASTYGTAVVKILPRRRKRLARKVNKYGVSTFSVKYETRLEFQAIDPFDCYPSKGSKTIQDGYFCQRIRYQPADIAAMEGEKGYIKDAVREVLQKYGTGSGYRTFQPTDHQVEQLNDDGTTGEESTIIEGVEFWGSVMGGLLLDENIQFDHEGKALERDKLYDVDALVVAGRVLFCKILDPRLGRPLFKGTFYNSPGSWWGESPIKKMRAVQKIANGAITSLVWNMGMAAGPQVAITDYERLRDRDLTQKPWKVWVFDKPRQNTTSDVPIKFFQPNTNSQELMGIYDRMSREADSLTGIPAYSYGSDVAAGAGRTASGLSMLMDAAQRGMKHVIFSLDLDLMRPMIEYLVNHEMLTNEDEGIKGDVTIDAGGLLAVLSKDKSSAMLKEVLGLCQNPLVAQVIGEDGISELMRKVVGLIPHINPDRIVPTREELEFRKLKEALEQMKLQQMQMQMAQDVQLQGQAQAAAMGLPSQGGGASAPQPVSNTPAGAAMGGQTPGSTYNQYQPNSVPAWAQAS